MEFPQIASQTYPGLMTEPINFDITCTHPLGSTAENRKSCGDPRGGGGANDAKFVHLKKFQLG